MKIKNNHYSFRYVNIAEVRSVKTTTTRYGMQSFRYAEAKLWNKLPNDGHQQMTLKQFKNFINT